MIKRVSLLCLLALLLCVAGGCGLFVDPPDAGQTASGVATATSSPTPAPTNPPGYAEGEYYRFNAELSGSLPAMQFEIKLTSGTYSLDGEEMRYNVVITDLSTYDVVQQLSYASKEKVGPYTFTLADLNFDGYLDLDITYELPASNEVHTFYLWDPQAKQFVETALSDLATSNYTLYPDSGIIENVLYDYGIASAYALYRYEKGELSKFRRAEVSEAEGGYTVRVYEIAGGGESLLFDQTYANDAFQIMVHFVGDLVWRDVDGARTERVNNILEQLEQPSFLQGESLRFTDSISSKLSNITFDITLEGTEGGVHTYLFTLYEKGRPDKVMQTFTVESLEKLDPLSFVKLVDLNFDGYNDLDIYYNLMDPDLVHTYYLWDVDAKQYVPADLGNLKTAWYTLYPDRGIIKAYIYSRLTDAPEITELYTIEDGMPKLLRRMVQRSEGNLQGSERQIQGNNMRYFLTITDYSTGSEVVLHEANNQPADVYFETYGDVEALLWEGLE